MGVRAFIAATLCVLTYYNSKVVASNVQSRDLGVADIPPCGIQCLFLTVPASGCSLDNIDCQCSDEGLAQTLAACMLANCTTSDTLGTSRVQADLCNLSQESKRTDVFLYTAIVYSVGFVSVALRIAGKLVSHRFGLDDWIVVAALLLTTVPLGCVLAMAKIGFGEHLWNLENGTLLPILRLFYISSSTYVLVLGLIKISLVLFYLEIFKTRRFEMSAYLLLAYITINSLVIFFLTIFACKPVSSFWNRDIKGKCMDLQALAYANSASAIVQDLILLVLPLVFIQNLQMKRYKKIAVGFMFGLGTLGCIATMVRLHALTNFGISIDPTWDYVPVTIWTEVELVVALVCVSLPSIRVLIVKLLPVHINEFLSYTSWSSRDRSNPTRDQDMPDQQRRWKKPSSWINISRDANDSGHGSRGRKSFMGSLLSRSSTTPSTHRHMRNGSRRLESALSNYSETGVAVTRPPFHNEQESDDVEMLKIPKSSRPSFKSRSNRDSRITALPAAGKTGFLPEGSFSELDVSRGTSYLDRKRRRGEQS